jgi:isocitrate dehydrogenase (NAD+)
MAGLPNSKHGLMLGGGQAVNRAGQPAPRRFRRQQLQNSNGVGAVVRARRKNRRRPIFLDAMKRGQAAQHERALTVEGEGLRGGLTVEEAALIAVPQRPARTLHQLFGQHRVRQPAGLVIGGEKRRGDRNLIRQSRRNAMTRLICRPDDAFEFVNRSLNQIARGHVRRHQLDSTEARIESGGGDIKLLAASPLRSDARNKPGRGRRQPIVARHLGRLGEKRQPAGPFGGRRSRRNLERVRERRLDCITDVVAVGRSVAAQQESQRCGCRRFIARQRVKNRTGQLLDGETDHADHIGTQEAAIIMRSLARTITLIHGDGIGPEVTGAVIRILAATGVVIEWEPHVAGVLAVEQTGDALPAALVESIRRNKLALKGPVTTPIGQGFTSVNVGLRKSLDLYVNLRPVWNLPGVPSRFDNVDLVIVRENTEDLYAGLEHQIVPGVVESLKIITEKASTRIGRFAFEYARTHGRKRVTAIHKANIMKMSDGLFLDSVRAVAREFPDIAYDERIIDAVCMQLVLHPERFDVLVLPNLYGDIVSDLAAGLVGGLGVVGAANLGTDCAVFEAVHGSAPDIAGKGIANPTALLLSAILMLRHIDEGAAADAVMKALAHVLTTGVRTPDLGGRATTVEFADAVCKML